jgi:iron complex outermembrane receptor protein
MSKFQRVLAASTALMAVGATTSGPATAQNQGSTTTQDESAYRLEVVTVTASKREENLQDVPISVTALTADVLERGNVRELADLVNLSPGLVIGYGSQPGNFSISMRGIGTFSNGIAVESDVAVVIDDVPVGFQAAAFKDLIDVERVEVLRGPQSTLFGKSAIAGVLNITTRAPSAGFSGEAMGLITDDEENRVGFTVSGPLSDDVRVRLTVANSEYDGNVTNLTNGEKVNGSSGLTATGKIEWTPTDNLKLSLAPRFNRNESTCCVSPITSLAPGLFYQGITQLPASTVLAGIPIGPDNTFIRADDRTSGGDSEVAGVTARLDYDFDSSLLAGHTFSSITSTDHYRMHDYQDIDGTDVPFLLYFPVAAPSGIDSGAKIDGYFHAKSLTQEFRLTSPGDTRLRYVTGLWYAKNDLDRYLNRGPVLQLARYLAVSSNTNYAAFAQANFDLTDRVGLIGGARFNHQEIDYTFDHQLTNLHFSGADQEDAVTGKGGIQFQWTPGLMAFATYSTGYKGQAYDLVSTFNARIAGQMPVPHETANSVEVGFKSTLFDQRVYLNATLFNTDFYGFQTSVTSTLPDGTFLTFLNSVGHLRTRGLELDGVARVTSNLSLNGSFAYTDATVAEFPNGPCYNGQTLAQGCYLDATNSRVQDLKGERLNNVPKYKFNIGGQYDIALPGSVPFDGFVGLTYRWQDDVNFSLSQDPRTVQKAYGVADLSLGLADRDGHYKFTVFANNLFDERFAQGIGNTTSGFSGVPGAVGSTWGVPRAAFRYFGARVNVNF